MANSGGLFSQWYVTGESSFKGETDSKLDISHVGKDSKPVSEILHGAAAMGVTRVREWEKRGEGAVSQTPFGVSDIDNDSWQPLGEEECADGVGSLCEFREVGSVDGEDENRTSFGIRVAGLGEDIVDISVTSVKRVAAGVSGTDVRASEGIGTMSVCESDDVDMGGGMGGELDVVEAVDV